MPKRKAQPEAADVEVGDGPSTSEGEELTSVVYVGHLPRGFYEDELLGFFSQFGKLTKVRVSRNKKTGNPKHYAFIEFGNKEVARIAAEAMDGYFMFKQQLKCRVLKASDVHPQLFKGANRKFKKIPWSKIERERQNKDRTPQQQAARVARLVKKDQKRATKIAASGITYEYQALLKPQKEIKKKEVVKEVKAKAVKATEVKATEVKATEVKAKAVKATEVKPRKAGAAEGKAKASKKSKAA